ncbi:MAG: hypothetical protein ACREHV_06060 [Rhizomicrobium sp.]
MPDFSNPIESLVAPLALVVLILMGGRLSRTRNTASGGYGWIIVIGAIVAAGFFWVYAAVGLVSRYAN